MQDFLFGPPTDPADALLRAYVWAAPLLIVVIVGMVLAIGRLRNDRQRPAMVALIIGLALLFLRAAGRPWWGYWLSTSDAALEMGPDRLQDLWTVVDLCLLLLDTVGLALVVVAAVAWRGSGVAVAGVASSSSIDSSRVAQVPTSNMPPLSYGLRMVAMYVPILLSVLVSGVVIVVSQDRAEVGVVLGLLFVSTLLLVVGVVAFAMTIHALWKTIQAPPAGVGFAGIARTSPGKAVGLLFIPLFNFYWVFQVWVGLATDMNRTLDERGIEAPRLSRGTAVTICVSTICSMIPYVGALFSLLNLVLLPVFLYGAFRAANLLRSGASASQG